MLKVGQRFRWIYPGSYDLILELLSIEDNNKCMVVLVNFDKQQNKVGNICICQ